jgi:hypothetical protein
MAWFNKISGLANALKITGNWMRKLNGKSRHDVVG